MATTKLKPKQTTKKILSPLKDRAFDVVVNRFGLSEDAKRKTLEAIGEKYGITRERVRQIEHAALNAIRKSDAFKSEKATFEEIKNMIDAFGGLVAEGDFLNTISKDPKVQNHIHFYLVLGDEFTKHKEDEHFQSRWSTDDTTADQVHNSLKKLYESLHDDDLVSENDLINKFIDQLKETSNKLFNAEIAKRWLSVSKKVNRNPLGEWGKAESSNVKTRGIKDFAFLMMRKHGSPMHFREVATAICDTFDKKTHVATCHNELIKDGRFVLVGRGIYALSEWGYKKGVVRDVIRDILKKEGPLSKEDIIDRVLKERYLKQNTILVNLQNPKYFKKNKNGLYVVA
jgi:hypothetical protein